MRRLVLLVALTAGCGSAAAAPQDAAPANPPAVAAARPWSDPSGTAIVGFGLLRLVPPAGKKATFEISYRENPDHYGTRGGDEFQLFVLPADAFAKKPSAYADEFLAFTKSKKAKDAVEYSMKASVEVASETSVLVCYGPWTALDLVRPPGDKPTFHLDVTSKDGAFEWLESEMGELITSNWTNRPEVKRGGPCRTEPIWIEVRPMVLYDGRTARAADDVASRQPGPACRVLSDDTKESLDDQRACESRADRRITLTREVAEKLGRVPIRWR